MKILDLEALEEDMIFLDGRAYEVSTLISEIREMEEIKKTIMELYIKINS